jgi:hypothetical protein
MAEIFICETGQLSTESKRALKRAGVVVAEVADIARCQFLRASEIVSSNDMLWATLDALNTKGHNIGGQDQREKLAANLLAIVLESRKPPVTTD